MYNNLRSVLTVAATAALFAACRPGTDVGAFVAEAPTTPQPALHDPIGLNAEPNGEPSGDPNWALLNAGLPAWQPKNSNNNATDTRFSMNLINVNPATQVVRLTTTMVVPPQPPAVGTLFVWPGLAPNGGPNPNNMPAGTLHPVLTWGPSCAPDVPSDTYASWWVSAQFTDNSNCFGGASMPVAAGDALRIDILKEGNDWTQTVTDLATQQHVTYLINLEGSWQNAISFIYQDYGRPVAADMVFVNTRIELADAVEDSLDFVSECARCFATQPLSSADRKTFVIPRLILRDFSTPQTYPN